MDFLENLLRFFKKELENKNFSVNLYENTEMSHFFGGERKGNTFNVSYNPNNLMSLKPEKAEDLTIELSAKYFAEHESKHWTQELNIFNTPEFERFNPTEQLIMLKDSHGDNYFSYNKNNLRYLFIEVLVDSSLESEYKDSNNLFIQYNLKKLNEAIRNLNFQNYKDELDDPVMRRGFIRNLKEYLQKILERALRLYALNCKELVRRVFNKYEINAFFPIVQNTFKRLIEVHNSNLPVELIKDNFIEIKNSLEMEDYIQIFSQIL